MYNVFKFTIQRESLCSLAPTLSFYSLLIKPTTKSEQVKYPIVNFNLVSDFLLVPFKSIEVKYPIVSFNLVSDFLLVQFQADLNFRS